MLPTLRRCLESVCRGLACENGPHTPISCAEKWAGAGWNDVRLDSSPLTGTLRKLSSTLGTCQNKTLALCCGPLSCDIWHIVAGEVPSVVAMVLVLGRRSVWRVLPIFTPSGSSIVRSVLTPLEWAFSGVASDSNSDADAESESEGPLTPWATNLFQPVVFFFKFRYCWFYIFLFIYAITSYFGTPFFIW